MKVFPRTQFGDPILRSKAKNVPLKFLKTVKFKKLTERMLYTMSRSNGVGIAAPQIDEPLKIAVMQMGPTPTRPKSAKKGPIIIVNPRIIKYSRDKVFDWEGCLSFNYVRGSVPRSKKVTVEYRNEKGEKINEEATGMWARIFQHEIDHLNGVVYVDRMNGMKTLMTLQEFKKRILKEK